MTAIRKPTRSVRIGTVRIGAGHPVAVQSMCATKTENIDATVQQARQLAAAGAGIVRIAVDNGKEADALKSIRQQTEANLSVDLQENYRLAVRVAPWVDKIRYNPGHLYHHERKKQWRDKVAFIADIAGKHDCALRVGVNAGSVDPEKMAGFAAHDSIAPMLASALEHCEHLDRIGFKRYCVSLKDSDPLKVIDANRRFAAERPDVPLHLGVTEAGMPPDGILKTRMAFERLIAEGIGDTIRVSLTLPNERKAEEVAAGLKILDDIENGRMLNAALLDPGRLNIISCPSCSRVENESFIELAHEVKKLTRRYQDQPISIAVMGCRVNGPGETDDADIGLWCGPKYVNLKRKSEKIGSFRYHEILPRLEQELRVLMEENQEE